MAKELGNVTPNSDAGMGTVSMMKRHVQRRNGLRSVQRHKNG